MTKQQDDKRNSLLQLLTRYKPLDALDEGRCAYICEFVEKTPACFERSHEQGHITGSAWIVDGTGKKTLLTRHKKLGKWLQLGGHADGNADILAVALREAKEESGLTDLEPVSNEIFDVDVHAIPHHDNEPEHYHYDIRFLFRSKKAGPLKTSKESHAVAWVDLDALGTYSQEDSLFRMAIKWERLAKPSATPPSAKKKSKTKSRK